MVKQFDTILKLSSALLLAENEEDYVVQSTENREKSSEISAYLKNAFNCERSVVESILRLSVAVLQDLNFFGVRV